MLNMRLVIAGFLCVAAAGADAQPFEQQLFQFSQHAAVMTRHTRQAQSINAQSQDQPAWRTVGGDHDTFTIDMPAAPSYSTRVERVEDTGRAKYDITIYSLGAGVRDHNFFADTAFFPIEMDYLSDRTRILMWMVFLEKALKSNNLDGRQWSNIKWTNHQGRPAVDLTTSVSGGKEVRFFITFQGRQMFSLCYSGPTGSAGWSDVDRFIGSLRIR